MLYLRQEQRQWESLNFPYKIKVNKMKKEMKKIVTDLYTDKVNLKDSVRLAYNLDPDFDLSQAEKVLQNYAKELGLYLSKEGIVEKITKEISSTSFLHYTDILAATKKIVLPQLSFNEIKILVVKLSKAEASVIAPHAKFLALNSSNKNTKWGELATWIKDHPDFTPQEINNAGLIPDCPNRTDYLELAIGFKFLYDNLKTA